MFSVAVATLSVVPARAIAAASRANRYRTWIHKPDMAPSLVECPLMHRRRRHEHRTSVRAWAFGPQSPRHRTRRRGVAGVRALRRPGRRRLLPLKGFLSRLADEVSVSNASVSFRLRVVSRARAECASSTGDQDRARDTSRRAETQFVPVATPARTNQSQSPLASRIRARSVRALLRTERTDSFPADSLGRRLLWSTGDRSLIASAARFGSVVERFSRVIVGKRPTL